MKKNLRLEWRTPEELADNPGNWRKHPQAQAIGGRLGMWRLPAQRNRLSSRNLSHARSAKISARSFLPDRTIRAAGSVKTQARSVSGEARGRPR